jgi:hypothetical protein
MEVICLQDEAFYSLIEEVVERLKENRASKDEIWVSPERAMEILNIKSKTTLQNLRDEGAIVYTQPQKKIILYNSDSIQDYLEKHKKEAF